MSRLEDAINNCAQKIAGFNINGQMIGIPNAIERIEKWLDNFSEFPGLDELLIKILDSIVFIPDDKIAGSVIGYVEKYINHDTDKLYYTSFGNKKDSSFRITARLNNRGNYYPFLPEALDKIKALNAADPTIIFIDDYLNSGGQFTRIISEWHEGDFLNHEQLQTLKSCKLCFMFYYGLNKGENQAKSVIAQYNLNSEVHILEKYDDENGIFGSREEVKIIQKGLPLDKTSKSLFVNFDQKAVQDFLEIISQAGLELIKQYKPNKPNFAERILGYGNSAKLFIGEYNVPTCTISCLWLGGKINVKGKEINWQPLLPRNEKITNKPEIGVLPSFGESNSLKHTSLTMNENCGEPFDLRITVKLEKAICQSPDLTHNSGFFFDKIKDELKRILLISGDKPETFVLSIDKDKLQTLNNLFSGIRINGADKLIGCQLKNIDIFCFGKQESYFSIRICFKELSLEEALQLNYLITKPKNLQINYDYNNQICKSTDSFISQILSQICCKQQIVPPLLLSSYLRIEKPDYQNIAFRNRITAILGAKLNPVNEIIKKEFAQIDADNYKTVYTANKSCFSCICQAGIEYNDSWLQNHFQSRFLTIFLLVHHLELMKLKSAGKGKKRLFSIKSAADKWLERLSVLERVEPCVPDSIYLNRFYDVVKNSFK